MVCEAPDPCAPNPCANGGACTTFGTAVRMRGRLHGRALRGRNEAVHKLRSVHHDHRRAQRTVLRGGRHQLLPRHSNQLPAQAAVLLPVRDACGDFLEGHGAVFKTSIEAQQRNARGEMHGAPNACTGSVMQRHTCNVMFPTHYFIYMNVIFATSQSGLMQQLRVLTQYSSCTMSCSLSLKICLQSTAASTDSSTVI